MNSTYKLAITGTHSTGKSTFLKILEGRLKQHGLSVGYVGNLALRARALGFPILADHNIESTLWIIAECIRQEAELSLTCDVILVDRPVLDALGYLKAGLEVSGRHVDPKRLERLYDITRAHTGDYSIVVRTILDPTIPVGQDRDTNEALRLAADRHIAELVADLVPGAAHLKVDQNTDLLEQAERHVIATLGLAEASESDKP